MTLPHVLLVDDSEAMLAYERAALSGHFRLSTAATGAEAVVKIPHLEPDLVVLDLSMPEMDGEEVLARCKADPTLARIPFVIVSAELERAEKCLKSGAAAVLSKPFRAKQLLILVNRVLDEARREELSGLQIVEVIVGPVRIGVPLSYVRAIVSQPACRPLPVGPMYLREVFEFEEEPICVLDLALRMGMEYAQPLVDRKMVIVTIGKESIALNVDDVRDPVEVPRARTMPRDELGGGDHRPLSDVLVALVRTDDGPLPVIDPTALLSQRRLRELAAAARAGVAEEEPT